MAAAASCLIHNDPQTLQIIGGGNLPKTCASQSTLNLILSDLFILLGAIAFLMIVIAGLRYVFARGTPEKTTQAKNIIQYSVIGLILAASAYAIVNVIIQRAG